MRPRAIIEGKGFLKLMAALEPKWKIPSRKTLMNVYVARQYLHVKTFIKQKIKEQTVI